MIVRQADMYGERRPVTTREHGGVGACMGRTISGHRVRPPDLPERRGNYVKSGAEDGRMLDTSEDNDTAGSTYSDGDGDDDGDADEPIFISVRGNCCPGGDRLDVDNGGGGWW